MTSIVGYDFRLNPGEQPPQWSKFDWDEDIIRNIYTGWGTYYFSRRRENLALHYYTQALELDASDHVTLYKRSQNQRKLARIESTLKDATNAASEYKIIEKYRK